MVKQVQYRVWIEVACTCTIPLKSQLPKSHLTCHWLHLIHAKKQYSWNFDQEKQNSTCKMVTCMNLWVVMWVVEEKSYSVMMIACMCIYLLTSVKNLLVWFPFQLYVDSNSLPKYKDRKSVVFQMFQLLQVVI